MTRSARREKGNETFERFISRVEENAHAEAIEEFYLNQDSRSIMLGSYKFVRFRNGITSYAKVSVEAWPSTEFSITWTLEMKPSEEVHADTVARGLEFALEAHRARGGLVNSFRVVEFGELYVDTKDDAVFCAAVAAAWASLGHPETDIEFTFQEVWIGRLLV